MGVAMTVHDLPETCEEQALAWFTRSLDAPLPDDQQQVFLAWLDASPEHADAYARVENLWQADSFEQALRDLESDLAPTRRPRTRRWTGWATAAAITLALGTWFGDLPLRLQADYLTAVGEQQRITLADGSHLLLGSDSAVSATIDNDQRSLRLLRGDLYLEAAHDSQRPLRIKADKATVEVVGTRFSVRLRDDDVAVAVDEGRVRLSTASGESSLLGPGTWQHLRGERLGELHAQGSADQHGWTEGRLIFQDRPLAEVLEELGRERRAPILMFGDAGKLRVSGNYRLDDPETVVTALTRLAGARLARLPGGILVVH